MKVASTLRWIVTALALAAVGTAFAVDTLRFTIPAPAGSALDATAHELGEALVASGGARNIQYDNRPGAAGTIGLVQFVSQSKGDPAALFMGGASVMRGVAQNRSAVTLSQVTALARLTQDPQAEWHGVFAAPAITSAQRDEWIQAIEKATRSAHWRETLKASRRDAAWLSGDAFAAYVETEGRRIADMPGPARDARH